MKNNKGFIATSIMYSFFMVFTIICLLILATYSHFRSLINNINNNVLSELNEVISNKYAYACNLVSNGNFDEGTLNWNTAISNYDTTIKYSGLRSAKFEGLGNTIYQDINLKNNSVSIDSLSHKFYLAFRLSRNEPVTDADISLTIGSQEYKFNKYMLAFDERAVKTCASEGKSRYSCSFRNWNISSAIIDDVNVSSPNAQLKISANGGRAYIDDVILMDITGVYGDGTEDDEMKTYLDRYYSNYFTGCRSITRK